MTDTPTDDRTNEVQLSEPIKVRAEELWTLYFRPPRTGDLRCIDDPNLGRNGRSIALIAQLAGVPIGAVERLALADYAACCEVVDRFFEIPGLFEESEEGSG